MKSALVTIIAGCSAWLIALVVLLAIGAAAAKIWTCIFGFILGLIGVRYTIRRARRGEL